MPPKTDPAAQGRLQPADPRTGVLDALPAMVWCADPDASVTYCNKLMLQYIGETDAEAGPGAWIAALHPDDRERFHGKLLRVAGRMAPFEMELRIRRHDGRYRWMLAKAQAYRSSPEEPWTYLGTTADITDQHARESESAERDQFVRLLGESTSEGVWMWDVSYDRVRVNNTVTDLLGAVPVTFPDAFQWWKSRVHPDDHQRVLIALEQAFLSDRNEFYVEYRIADIAGKYRVVQDRLSILRDAQGTAIQVFGAFRDLTERKRAEEQQQRLARILEATTDFVSMATPDGRIVYLNRAAREASGLASQTQEAEPNITQLHPPWALEIIMHEGLPTARKEGVWRGETAVLGPEGVEIPVSQLLISHSSPGGDVEFISTIMRDISDRKREEVARIEWANRYDAAIRASGQLLFDWDSVTNEITYGGSTQQLLGYSLAEMAGGLDRFRELIHPEDLPAFDTEIHRVSSTRDPFFLEFRMRCKDGRDLFVQDKGYFFLDRAGRLTRMIGFLADISAQRIAQEELARAHDQLEARVTERTAELAQAYIVIQDRALQQEAVSHLGQRALAGAELSALLDEAAALVRTILKVDLCAVYEITDPKGDLLFEASAGWPGDVQGVRLPRQPGSMPGHTLESGEPLVVENFTTEERFAPALLEREVGAASGLSVMIAGEQPIGVLAAYSLTPRAFTKDDVHFLQAVANVLTAAIGRQRAEESVRAAREQAETANRAKSEFLSRMSHELRTPLNAILGFTQLLELEAATASQTESIRHISRAGHHLLSLINEVLDIARIESGRLALATEPVPLLEFLRGAVELIRPLSSRHQVTLYLDADRHSEELCVLADPQRLKQVLLNLLSNAVKYNRSGGSVNVACAPMANDRVSITVRDTGWGIAPDKMPRLFMPFERLGAETTDIEGTGIGLALSRGIVTALGGELTAESEQGVGSVFRVVLPGSDDVPTIANPPITIMPAIGPDQKVSTLLYIEDQDLNLRLVERILLHHPEYKLLSTAQGGLGLDLAREHRPDLVLLDLNLPDIPGDEVLARMQADETLRHIPVIMVSADAMGDRIEKLLAQGAAGYITKPYKVGEFLRVIREGLQKNA